MYCTILRTTHYFLIVATSSSYEFDYKHQNIGRRLEVYIPINEEYKEITQQIENDKDQFRSATL